LAPQFSAQGLSIFSVVLGDSSSVAKVMDFLGWRGAASAS
jgi:hypothetical protein